MGVAGRPAPRVEEVAWPGPGPHRPVPVVDQRGEFPGQRAPRPPGASRPRAATGTAGAGIGMATHGVLPR
jgi:hypothetical protein